MNANHMRRTQIVLLLGMLLAVQSTFSDLPPPGWNVGGCSGSEFAINVDASVKHTGKMSTRVESVPDKKYECLGSVSQKMRADPYKGKTLILSAYIKTDHVKKSAHLWFVVRDKDKDALVRARGPELRGTADWQRSETTIDVPQDGVDILAGFTVADTGRAWVDDVELYVTDGVETNAVEIRNSGFEEALEDNEDWLSRLYHDGTQLARWGQADRAIETLSTYLELAGDKAPISYLEQTYGWLSYLHGLRGDYETGIAEQIKAIEYLDAQRSQMHISSFLNQKIFRLDQLVHKYWQMGKLGMSFQYYQKMLPFRDELLQVLANDTSGKRRKSLIKKKMYAPWIVKRQESRFIDMAGHSRKAAELSAEVAEEIEEAFETVKLSSNNRQQILWTYGFAAIELGRMGYLEKGIEYLERCLATKKSNFKAHQSETAISALRHAAFQMELRGPSEAIWEEAESAFIDILHLPKRADHMTGHRIVGSMLARDGQYEDAMERYGSAITIAREDKRDQYLPRTLMMRAQLFLEHGDFTSAARDLLEALSIARRTGYKPHEPLIYHLYGRCLAMEGNHNEAFRVWDNAFMLLEKYGMHHLALQVLVDTAELQMKLGLVDDLDRTWARIMKYVEDHPDIAPIKLLPMHLARLDYLKFKGDMEALKAHYGIVQGWAAKEGLTDYQMTPIGKYDLSEPTQTKAIARPTKVVAELQPLAMNTFVDEGEIARARFNLYNPSGAAANGAVTVAIPDHACQWIESGEELLVTLARSSDPEAATRTVEVPAGDELIFYLQSPAIKKGQKDMAEVTWKGDGSSVSTWNFGYDPAAQRTAIVNASLIEDNPFFLVPFYHEIYFRDLGSKPVDLKVIASEPCRVEIADERTLQVLAIDANGDGDFDDKGDSLNVDENRNGYPDIVATDGQDVASIELLVYPAYRSTDNTRDIEIMFYLKDGNEWKAQALDTLSVGNGQ